MSMVATLAWSMLFMPSAMLISGLAVGLVVLWRCWRKGHRPGECRLAVAWTALCAALLLLGTTPWFAVRMLHLTEHPHGPVDPASPPQADAIVVLGGSMAATRGSDGTVHLLNRTAGDRFETGLRAWRLGRAPIVAFGGGAPSFEDGPAKGEWYRMGAVERGVPEDAAIARTPALFTSDESAAIVHALESRGARRIILCTSATHMTRAPRIYRAHDLKVVPLPCDLATRGDAERFSWWTLVPRGVALCRVDLCAKEWLGRLALSFAGR